MSWLFDLFVAPGITAGEIAEMNIEPMAEQISELREAGVAEGMSDAEIAEAIHDFACDQARIVAL